MKTNTAKVTALAVGGCMLLGMMASAREKAAKADNQPQATSVT